MILIICIFLPVLNLAIIPIRSGLASAHVSNFAKQLSLSERFSQAKEKLAAADGLVSRLKSIGGVDPKDARLSLIIDSMKHSGNQITVDRPGSIPAEWQPNGQHCQCEYVLSLSVDADVSPLIKVPLAGLNVPGLNAPILMTFSASAPFENLGRDPDSQEYFLNE